MKVDSLLFLCFFTFITKTIAEILDPCNCHMLGTIESIDGQSICKANQNCKCLSNVVGLNCDNCKLGYYGFFGGRGCKKCVCDPDGSTLPQCNVSTGQCTCKANFSGYLCNKCKANFYRANKDTCKSCNCNILGSKDPQCDGNGQCPCLPNFEGRSCDKCVKDTQDITKGCTDCPECYNIIKNQVEYLEIFIQKVSILLENSLESSMNIDLEKFMQSLITLQTNIISLKDKVKTLDDMNTNQVSLVSEKLAQIDSKLAEFGDKLKTKDASGVIEDIRDNLSDKKKLIEDWSTALRKAMKVSDNVQQTNKEILNIMKNAVKISKNMETAFKDLRNTSEVANATCNSVVESLESFAEEHAGIKLDLESLRNDLEEMHSVKGRLTSEVEQATSKSTKTQENAAHILEKSKQLALDIAKPAFNVTRERIAKAEIKLNDFHSKNNQIQEVLRKLLQTFRDGVSIRKENEQNFEEIEEFSKKSDDIIEEIESFIEEQIKILQEFNKNINNKEQLANKKLKGAALIRANIKKLLNKLRIEQKQLEENAKQKIIKSKEKSVNTNKNLKQNTNAANNLKEELKDLGLNLNNTVTNITKGEAEIIDYIKKVEIKLEEVKLQNKDLLELRKNLEQTKTLNENLDFKKFERETKKMKELTAFINELPLSDKQFINVERQIRKAENNLRNYEAQREERRNYKTLLQEYNALEKEVKAVKALSESLKKIDHQCFSSRPIEAPPDI